MRDLTNKGLSQLILGLDLVHQDTVISVNTDERVDKIVGFVGDLEFHFKIDDLVLVVLQL